MYECHLFRDSETMTQLSSVCAHYERPKDSDAYDQTDSTPGGPMPPFITVTSPPSKPGSLKTLAVPRRWRRRGMDSISIYNIVQIFIIQKEATNRSPPNPHLQWNLPKD